jgi:hypothetical protein
MINVIAGGISGGSKRPWDESEYCAQVNPNTIIVLSFTHADMPTGKRKENEPLVITETIDGFEVHRIFIDQSSSVDILLWDLFLKLGLGTKDLVLH